MNHRAFVLAAAGLLVLALALADGVLNGNFTREGGALMDMPWGRATLVDVYVGLCLFSGWVFYRERRTATAALWTAAFLATGNLATCCYVARALLTSGGSPAAFWMGVDRAA